jgi:predicted small lipoprotein YifL
MRKQLVTTIFSVFLVMSLAGCAGQQTPTTIPDSDGDGVPDDIDKCPNTPKGVKVNAIGCWEMRDVNFDVDKAVIKNPQVLDEVVTILKINPTMTGEVRGYTYRFAGAQPETLGIQGQGRARLFYQAGDCA